MKNLKHYLTLLALAAILPFSAAMAQLGGGGKPLPTVGDPLTPEEGEIMQEGMDAMPCFLCPLVRKSDDVDVRRFVDMHPCNSNSAHAIDFDANGVDGRGRTALYFAAILGEPAIIRTLFALPCLGTDINLANTDNGRTPLYAAVFKEHEDAVRELIDRNADVNIRDFNQKSPVMVALEKKNYPIIRMLRDARAVLPKPENTLIYVIDNEIGYLIDPALEALTPDFPYDGYPAVIFWAGNNLDFVRALMEDGANCGAQYYRGRTVLNYAKQQGNADIIRELENRGCLDDFTEEVCYLQDRILINGECIECREAEPRDGNRCVADPQICYDQDERFVAGACEACGNDVLVGNTCTRPKDCRDDQERAADGVGCECPAGEYETGMGYCAKICTETCKAYDTETKECECPSNMLLMDNKCVVPPPCGGGMVVSSDMMRCVCPDNFPNQVGDFCRGEVLACGYGKHKHRPWHSNHKHAGVKYRQIGIHTGAESISACECNTEVARSHGFGGRGCH